MNHTDAAIVVTLTIDLNETQANWCLLEPGKNFIGPSVVPTAELSRWYEVDQQRYEINYDPVACSINMTVPPGHSAVIWQESNYFDSRGSISIGDFPATIQLNGKIGEVQLQGPRLDKHFERRSEKLYVLNYGRAGT
jgi:hypothetical protein